ncbi:MAG: CDP-alcohol phosphatidyltransferase family protein [Planctomycetota bacterium]|nr:CDP-alcohol phosphatidyltransferase family protein [Planctomycetota bacterium]
MNLHLRSSQVLAPQNLVTLGNLACGVGAILLCITALVESQPEKLYQAALWLVLAEFLDGVDGKIARLTGSASPLGAQLDSLADAVTFGVAPGILAFSMWNAFSADLGLSLHPRLLMVAPVVYAACAVLRLARFNVDHEEDDLQKENVRFVGLPSPGAAGMPISMSLLYFGIADIKFVEISSQVVLIVRESLLYAMPFILILMGVLMVSRVPFPHFFAWMTRSKAPVATLAKFIFMFGFMFIEPEACLFLFSFCYTLVPIITQFLPSRRTSK